MPTNSVPATLYATGEVQIAAASDGDDGKQLRKFSMVAYTGGAMQLGGWPAPVVVDLAGLKVTQKARPILRDHDAGKIVGHTESVDIEANRVLVSGVLSAENLFSREVTASSDNGFPWQSSIGASVQRAVFVEEGESVTVNGRKFSGPLYVARRTTLGEISFVALGADDNTSARLAASAASSQVRVDPMDFEKWLEAMGLALADLSDDQQTKLRAKFDGEKNIATVTQGNARVAAQQVVNPPQQHQAPPVQAAATPSGSTKQLDQIFAERRAEDARVAEITRITAEAINDRPMLTDEFERMSRAAIEAKSTPQEYELEVLRASRAPSSIGSRGGYRDRKVGEKVLTAAVCASVGLPDIDKHFDDQTLQAAHDRFPHGIGLCELLVMAAKENGFHDISSRNVEGLLRAAFPQNNIPGHVRAQGWSTFSLSGILGNAGNKFIGVGFNSVESTWREIAATRSVRDFKEITSYSLTGGMMYEKVAPQGELKHATVGEQSYTNKAETYGRMFAISRQDIINDDLGMLDGLRQRIGRGGALKLNDVFWTEFLDNATFFTAARGNYDDGADTALSIGALTLAETLFMNQTDPDGFPMAVAPEILLVPNGIYTTAAQLMNTTQIIDGTGSALQPASNPHAGKFRVVRSSYLSNANYTGYSALAYYLLANPSTMPVIEVAFLNGRDMPIVESADADFNTLGVQFRGYFDFGVNLQEYRGGVKMKGEA